MCHLEWAPPGASLVTPSDRPSSFVLAAFALLAAFAAVALVAFLIIEARSTHPMLPLRLFRNPSFTGAQIAAFGISASFFALYLYATLYLQDVLGLSAIDTGVRILPLSITLLILNAAAMIFVALIAASETNDAKKISTTARIMFLLSVNSETSSWNWLCHGTGSGPCPPQGWQRPMRFSASHPPRSAP